MKRNRLFATIGSVAVLAAAPALADPGGGNGGGQAMGGGVNANANVNAGGAMGETMREIGRASSEGPEYANPRAIERANENSVLRSGTDTSTETRIRGNGRIGEDISTGSTTGSNIVRSSGRTHAESRARADTDATATMNGKVDLTGVESGMTVVDADGATVGTVTGVTTRGNDSIRAVQVTLTDGTIVTLSPKSLSVDGDQLVTSSLETNIKSQGALHANVNGLVHASPNSALAVAGVTSLTGLAADLTVQNSAGTSVGTVDSIVTNRSGAVVGINVDLTSGGTVFVPATSLKMDGTTVVSSSTTLDL